MARPRKSQSYASLHAASAALLSGADVTARDSKSGGEWHNLLSILHREDARCIICDLATVRTQWLGAMTATLGLLVPSSALDSIGGKHRRGYVGGNLAVMCSACVDARGEYGAREDRVVVLAPTRAPLRRTRIGGVAVTVVGLDLDPVRVPLVLPTLRKEKAPEVPDPATVALITRRAEGRVARSAAARAARGLPF